MANNTPLRILPAITNQTIEYIEYNQTEQVLRSIQIYTLYPQLFLLP